MSWLLDARTHQHRICLDLAIQRDCNGVCTTPIFPLRDSTSAWPSGLPWIWLYWISVVLTLEAPPFCKVHNLLATEERDDAHYSFVQVKKGYVLITRMESITGYKNQYGQHRSESDGQKKKGRGVLFVFRTKHLKRFKTKKMKLKVQFPVNIEAIFSRPHRKTLRNATHHSLMEQERAITEIQKVNSELSHQVTELQDQLQAERESTQERINFERAKRENLEERLKEERAETERLLEEERRSTLEFEKNMMAKFAQFSQQMQTHQMNKKKTNKEISNPNLQNTLLQTASTTGTLGTRHNVIAPNMLIQAANIRMFRAMDPKIN
ncbi:hypothetical protein TRIUR3_32716 [Triticum urartu]|uniref:Uncharacterized protein n=1 Tax=Triticum urartu TaxID=4572 RepID=M8A9C6_TRIUA|nr:hypothetical protein TRIUR3_32716 [Triticum urartu]